MNNKQIEEIISRYDEKLKGTKLLERVFSWSSKTEAIKQEMIKKFENSVANYSDGYLMTIDNLKEQATKDERKYTSLVNDHIKEIAEIKSKHQDELHKLEKTKNDSYNKLEREANDSYNKLERIKDEKFNSLYIELKDTKGKYRSELEKLNEEVNHKQTVIETQIKNTESMNYIKNIFATPVGKGQASEKRVENYLSQYLGDENVLWTKNLKPSPKDSDIVEFAFRANKNDKKWIPIDSKSIHPSSGEGDNGKIIIDGKYISKIRSQANKISKYLNQPLTKSYGFLVLPNTELLIKVLEDNKFKSDLLDIFENKKIYVISPEILVQTLHSIAILDTQLEISKNSAEILKKIMLILKQNDHFRNNIVEAITKLSTGIKQLDNANENTTKLKKLVENNQKIDVIDAEIEIPDTETEKNK